MWKDLLDPWKRSFELAWESYCRGTIPIGSVITDNKGVIISEGRNRIFDTNSTNPLAGTFMAHAEITAMMQLKSKDHPDIRTYTLYTTLEPCPMCFGAIIMMNIRNIKYAARDTLAGALLLNDKMDYIRSKSIGIEKGDNKLEAFQLIMLTSYECSRNHTRMEEMFSRWMNIDKYAIELGKLLYSERYFDKAVAENAKINDIYDYIINRYEHYIKENA